VLRVTGVRRGARKKPIKNKMEDYISTFRIPIDKIPQAKNWKVGGKYRVVAEVEQTGVNKERDYSTASDSPIGVAIEKKVKQRPKYKTVVEFKVTGVSAYDRALRSRV